MIFDYFYVLYFTPLFIHIDDKPLQPHVSGNPIFISVLLEQLCLPFSVTAIPKLRYLKKVNVKLSYIIYDCWYIVNIFCTPGILIWMLRPQWCVMNWWWKLTEQSAYWKTVLVLGDLLTWWTELWIPQKNLKSG